MEGRQVVHSTYILSGKKRRGLSVCGGMYMKAFFTFNMASSVTWNQLICWI